MARSPDILHAVVLTLVALLAWPWNVTLAAAEASHVRAPERTPVLTRRSAAEKRLAKATRWHPATVPAVSQDRAEQEEEDGTSVPDPDAGLFTVAPDPPRFPRHAPGHIHQRARVGSLVTGLCRLRC